jgi:hypothetical protein
MTTDITRRSDATSTQDGSADARDEAESTLGSVADRAGAGAEGPVRRQTIDARRAQASAIADPCRRA